MSGGPYLLVQFDGDMKVLATADAVAKHLRDVTEYGEDPASVYTTVVQEGEPVNLVPVTLMTMATPVNAEGYVDVAVMLTSMTGVDHASYRIDGRA